MSEEIGMWPREFSLFSTPRQFGVINKDPGDPNRAVFSFTTAQNDSVEPRVLRRLTTDTGSKLGLVQACEFSLPLLPGLKLPLGITVITGPTSVGKSDFMRSLGEFLPPGASERVIAVEPPDTPYELQNLQIFNSADAALLYCAARELLSLETRSVCPLMMLDSLREPLLEINGPASERGMIMPFFTAITRVSNSLALNGLTVLASVNPLQEDDQYFQMFTRRLAASVPCYIKLSSAQEINASVVKFSGTIAMRPDRKERSFAIELPNTRDPDRSSGHRRMDLSLFAEPVVLDLTTPPMVSPLAAALKNTPNI